MIFYGNLGRNGCLDCGHQYEHGTTIYTWVRQVGAAFVEVDMDILELMWKWKNRRVMMRMRRETVEPDSRNEKARAEAVMVEK